MAATSPLLPPVVEAPRLSLVPSGTPSSSPPAKSELHFSARSLGPLLRWIEETQGSAALTAILERAGTTREDVRG